MLTVLHATDAMNCLRWLWVQPGHHPFMFGPLTVHDKWCQCMLCGPVAAWRPALKDVYN